MKKTLYVAIASLAILAGLLAAVSCGAAPTSTPGTNAQVKPTGTGATPGPDFKPAAVEIKGFAFNPATVTVPVGTTVTWTNNDPSTHTVTSSQGNVLNSPNLPQGGTFSYTFNQKGTFEYHCAIHTSMTGKVIVQ
jgi:plastocyanin